MLLLTPHFAYEVRIVIHVTAKNKVDPSNIRTYVGAFLREGDAGIEFGR